MLQCVNKSFGTSYVFLHLNEVKTSMTSGLRKGQWVIIILIIDRSLSPRIDKVSLEVALKCSDCTNQINDSHNTHNSLEHLLNWRGQSGASHLTSTSCSTSGL